MRLGADVMQHRFAFRISLTECSACRLIILQ